MGYTLIIDSQTIADANAASSFVWEVPDNAHVKGDHTKPGGVASWSEIVEVTSSAMGDDEKEPGTTCIKLQFTVPADVTSVNVGRQAHQMWLRVTPAAFHNKNHEKYKRNNFAIARLNGLLRACGFEIPSGESVDYGAYFDSPDAGTPSPVVSQRVVAYMKKRWYEGKPQMEITDFQSVGEGNS